MKRSLRAIPVFFFALAIILALPQHTHALSRMIGRDIEFPKNYPAEKARAILAVVRDERFDFRDGMVSYWPPGWSTRLSFAGDSHSLNNFLAAARQIPAVGLRVVFYRSQNSDDTDWQLEFSHDCPDQLTVYLNVNRSETDLTKLKLPEWPAN